MYLAARLLASVSLVLCTGVAQAETLDMDGLLNDSLSAGQSPDKIQETQRGVWILARDKSATPNACAIIFFDRKSGSSISYRGPRPGVGDKGSLVFIHPNIPTAEKPAEVKIVLETDGEPAQKIPAIHLPAQGNVPAAFLIPTDIRRTVAVAQQTEKVKINFNGKYVYDLEWDGGGHKARDALLNCLDGKESK